MLVSGNWAPLLTPGIRKIFSTVAGRPDANRDFFYSTSPSTRAFEEYQGFGGRRLVVPWAGTVPYEDTDAYYKLTLRNILLVDGLEVERSLLEDDQYGAIRQLITEFSTNFAVTREHDAVQTFENSFTDSGTNRLGVTTNGADGVALCSTAHPNNPRLSGDTQSNEATLPLTLANADTVRQRMLNFTDDKGQLMGVNPDMIVVPAELERTARQIFPQSEDNPFEPGSAEFNANLFQSSIGGHRMTVVMWNRLTDANAWWMIDSTLMRQHLLWQERAAPSVTEEGFVDSEKARWSGRMRYGNGWTHWGWIYGNNPS